jgi:FkbM family methyltransferase
VLRRILRVALLVPLGVLNTLAKTYTDLLDRLDSNLVRPPIPLESRPWELPQLVLIEQLRECKRGLTGLIIGAHHGYEVPDILATGTVTQLVLFEPSPQALQILTERMHPHRDHVMLVGSAVSDAIGVGRLYLTSLGGNDSILPPSAYGAAAWGIREVDSIEVDFITVDSFCSENDVRPDFLWIDVQGAEIQVLKGASESLSLATFCLVEVALRESGYEGGAMFDELETFLETHGFTCVQLATDSRTWTGNALFVRHQGLETLIR